AARAHGERQRPGHHPGELERARLVGRPIEEQRERHAVLFLRRAETLLLVSDDDDRVRDRLPFGIDDVARKRPARAGQGELEGRGRALLAAARLEQRRREARGARADEAIPADRPDRETTLLVAGRDDATTLAIRAVRAEPDVGVGEG